MGVIKDIADTIVPNAQIRAKSEGISNRQALYIELEKIGYIPKKCKEEVKHNM